jgi:hypothetical protein
MKLTKEPIYSAQTKGRPVMGRFRGLTMLFGAFLVIFVSAQSYSTARIRWADSSSSIPSIEKRQPFIPPTTHLLKTSFVSIDEKSDYTWFVADKGFDAVLLHDRAAFERPFKTFDSEDPPDSFLVLPLRI